MTDSARASLLLVEALDALVARNNARASDLTNEAHRLDEGAALIPDLGALLTFASGEHARTDSYLDRAIRRHWATMTPPVFADGGEQDRAVAINLIRIYRGLRARVEGSWRAPRIMTRLAQLNERIGNDARAREIYEEMREKFPGSGAGDTGRALACLKAARLLASPSRMSDDGPVVAKSDLGTLGRFANQILQYIYLRTYARRVGATPLAPNWVGRHLFELDDAPIDRILPLVGETDAKLIRAFEGKMDPLLNIDIKGFMQIHTANYAPERAWLQSLFKLRPYWRRIVDDAEAALRRHGETLIAVHVRLGDMSSRHADPLPAISKLLDELWPAWNRPVLFVASDDRDPVASALAHLQPQTNRDLWSSATGVEYLVDHQMVSRADIVVAAPGTFSFTAAMLNRRAKALFRTESKTGKIEPFDPWNDLPGAPEDLRIGPERIIRRKDGSISIEDIQP